MTISKSKGFTLPEMMIASMISFIIIGAMLTTFIMQRRTFHQQELIAEMQQNVRSAVSMVAADIQMAGYGIHVSDAELPDWVDWVPNLDANPDVVQGMDDEPDKVTVVAAFSRPATTATAVTNGSVTVLLSSGGGAHFNNTDKKIVYIGRIETARVVNKSGEKLTLSTDPIINGKGLKYDHPAGSPVELVQAVTYSWEYPENSYPYEPHLKRVDHASNYVAEWQKITSGNIENFQIIDHPYSVVVQITGRTSQQDLNYTDPDHGDHYRRITLGRKIAPRNARLKM